MGGPRVPKPGEPGYEAYMEERKVRLNDASRRSYQRRRERLRAEAEAAAAATGSTIGPPPGYERPPKHGRDDDDDEGDNGEGSSKRPKTPSAPRPKRTTRARARRASPTPEPEPEPQPEAPIIAVRPTASDARPGMGHDLSGMQALFDATYGAPPSQPEPTIQNNLTTAPSEVSSHYVPSSAATESVEGRRVLRSSTRAPTGSVASTSNLTTTTDLSTVVADSAARFLAAMASLPSTKGSRPGAATSSTVTTRAAPASDVTTNDAHPDDATMASLPSTRASRRRSATPSTVTTSAAPTSYVTTNDADPDESWRAESPSPSDSEDGNPSSDSSDSENENHSSDSSYTERRPTQRRPTQRQPTQRQPTAPSTSSFRSVEPEYRTRRQLEQDAIRMANSNLAAHSLTNPYGWTTGTLTYVHWLPLPPVDYLAQLVKHLHRPNSRKNMRGISRNYYDVYIYHFGDHYKLRANMEMDYAALVPIVVDCYARNDGRPIGASTGTICDRCWFHGSRCTSTGDNSCMACNRAHQPCTFTDRRTFVTRHLAGTAQYNWSIQHTGKIPKETATPNASRLFVNWEDTTLYPLPPLPPPDTDVVRRGASSERERFKNRVPLPQLPFNRPYQVPDSMIEKYPHLANAGPWPLPEPFPTSYEQWVGRESDEAYEERRRRWDEIAEYLAIARDKYKKTVNSKTYVPRAKIARTREQQMTFMRKQFFAYKYDFLDKGRSKPRGRERYRIETAGEDSTARALARETEHGVYEESEHESEGEGNGSAAGRNRLRRAARDRALAQAADRAGRREGAASVNTLEDHANDVLDKLEKLKDVLNQRQLGSYADVLQSVNRFIGFTRGIGARVRGELDSTPADSLDPPTAPPMAPTMAPPMAPPVAPPMAPTMAPPVDPASRYPLDYTPSLISSPALSLPSARHQPSPNYMAPTQFKRPRRNVPTPNQPSTRRQNATTDNQRKLQQVRERRAKRQNASSRVQEREDPVSFIDPAILGSGGVTHAPPPAAPTRPVRSRQPQQLPGGNISNGLDFDEAQGPLEMTEAAFPNPRRPSRRNAAAPANNAMPYAPASSYQGHYNQPADSDDDGFDNQWHQAQEYPEPPSSDLPEPIIPPPLQPPQPPQPEQSAPTSKKPRKEPTRRSRRIQNASSKADSRADSRDNSDVDMNDA
ncbi:uncharacterized protein DSM5745_07873 [Aspergillus mulundensis]|uniref:Zn(2)-C6 fungal-type domain-containing protein n=1 Tax=Aspergillus mulundensis TaxID=1810919 RepID=A0A3D8RFR1_9EURO|nr:hypothetical protein DSM5745_07873 [Aspergillus mulundensis]RDW72701.1 hypothetical protein DSM5745_07873 [Aspergillus mulundensis]